MTGRNEYFVVPLGKNRGGWYSENSIDLSSFIQHRFERRRSFREKKEQQDCERKLRELEIKRKQEAEIRKMESEKRQKEMEEKNNQHLKRKANPDVVKTKQAKKTKDSGLIKKHELEFQAAFDNHQADTVSLLRESAARGEKSVPTDSMTRTRAKNMAAVRAANFLIHQLGGRNLNETELTNKLAQAEAAAVKLYVAELKKTLNPQIIQQSWIRHK